MMPDHNGVGDCRSIPDIDEMREAICNPVDSMKNTELHRRLLASFNKLRPDFQPAVVAWFECLCETWPLNPNPEYLGKPFPIEDRVIGPPHECPAACELCGRKFNADAEYCVTCGRWICYEHRNVMAGGSYKCSECLKQQSSMPCTAQNKTEPFSACGDSIKHGE